MEQENYWEKKFEFERARRKHFHDIAEKERWTNLWLSVIIFLLLAVLFVKCVEAHSLNKQLEDCQQHNAELQGTIEEQHNLLMNTSVLVEELNQYIYDLTQSRTKLEQKYNSLVDAVNYYQHRQELYNKYEYALFYEGERTDIEYEHLATLDEIARINGYSPEVVYLTLALVITESHGIADAKNSESSARGLGQLIYGTAKFSYEELLGYGSGTYKKDYAFDPELNLRMTLAYVNYLCNQKKGNPIGVVDAYRGLHSTGYINSVAEKLDSAGLELKALQLY